MDVVRFGVIGAGYIATKFCEAVLGIHGHLYAIASRDIKKAESYQNKFGFEKAYDQYEDLLSDPNVDCVYIATPHGLHYDHMMLALKHKKNILCEKSFTLNARQAEAVLYKAIENHVFVMEAMWTRFLPTIQELKRLIDDGIIGKITHVEASFGLYADQNKERLFSPLLGGGALLDLGVYPITFANIILGQPKSFETEVKLNSNGYDVSEKMKYHYPDAIALLSSALDMQMNTTGIIKGQNGCIKVPNFWKAEEAYIYDMNHHLIQEISYPHIVNGLEYEIMEVIRCIESGLTESPIMPHAETIEIMKQMDALRNAWGFKYPQE